MEQWKKKCEDQIEKSSEEKLKYTFFSCKKEQNSQKLKDINDIKGIILKDEPEPTRVPLVAVK